MTQYLLSVHDVKDAPAPSDEEMSRIYAAVDTFNDEVRAAGVWVFAGGLQPVESATLVDATRSETIVTDGPFAESKEHLGGFWIIEAADLDEALSWAKRGSAACAAPVEVRPFQDEPA
jgi:hypothetical protein